MPLLLLAMALFCWADEWGGLSVVIDVVLARRVVVVVVMMVFVLFRPL